MEGCVLEIDPCILLNKLKLNKDKTELLVISSLHRARTSFVTYWCLWWESAGFTTFAAQVLVQALVTSKLYYCNSLLYGLPKNVIKQLQRVQNAAARVVTLSPKFCHITPVLANLHWLSIYLRIELKILIVTCKTLHGHAPTYIKDLLQCYLPARGLRSLKKIYLSCLL